MKKFKTLLATVALALPIAVTPLAPVATLLANAATTKAAKSTTETLVGVPTTAKVAYHTVKAGVPVDDISFAADKSVATLTPTTRTLATKTTYTTVKTIDLSTGKKGDQPTAYVLLKTSKGATIGWAKVTSLVKGAYLAPKATVATKRPAVKKAIAKKVAVKRVTTKAPAKKVTKKAITKQPAKKATTKTTTKLTAKKTTERIVPTKATWLLLTKRATPTKEAYKAGTATPYYRAAFTADRPTVKLTKTGNLKAGKTYRATKAFYAKTNAKAPTHEYVLLTGAGWTATTGLKGTK